jgi:hypothetical protein
MNLQFFIVGGLIFAVYMVLTIWNIFYSTQKQIKENSDSQNAPDKDKTD